MNRTWGCRRKCARMASFPRNRDGVGTGIVTAAAIIFILKVTVHLLSGCLFRLSDCFFFQVFQCLAVIFVAFKFVRQTEKVTPAFLIQSYLSCCFGFAGAYVMVFLFDDIRGESFCIPRADEDAVDDHSHAANRLAQMLSGLGGSKQEGPRGGRIKAILRTGRAAKEERLDRVG